MAASLARSAVMTEERKMDAQAQAFRLLRAVMRFVDRHAEMKDGPGVVQVPLLPHEMKELRASLEPFRANYKALESLLCKRVEEICDGAPATPEETAIRATQRL
jgi:hypothetical protein